jgi:hypothetical protein
MILPYSELDKSDKQELEVYLLSHLNKASPYADSLAQHGGERRLADFKRLAA